jgi:hypothetical protein
MSPRCPAVPSRSLALAWLVAALAACHTPTLDEVVANHRDAVGAVFAKIQALDGAVANAPPLTEDRVDVATGVVTLDGPDSNTLFIVATDLPAPDHASSTTAGATRAAAVQACGEALRGEFSGVAAGAESYLAQCGRAKYVFVLRPQVDEAAQMVGADSYSAGRFAGDVLLFRLADGAALGGFRFDAASNGSVMAHADDQGYATDAATRLDSDLSANAFVAIEEQLKRVVPGAVK